MNAAELVPVLKVLAAAFPNWKPSAETAEVWSGLLADQDGPSIARAAVQYARSGAAFPPSPGELIALARPAKSGRMLAMEAWGEVIRRAPMWSFDRAPWPDPLIGECVRLMGGMSVLGGVDGLGVANRARFIELYDGLAERGERIEAEESACELLDGFLGLRLGTAPDGPRRMLGGAP